MTHKRTLEVIVPEDSRQYAGGLIGISGPPGVGKSAVGRRVAEELGVSFYDLDDLIAKKVGVETTKEVIEDYGRSHFWAVEHQCLKEVFQRACGRYVLAFTGGVVCHRDTTTLKEKNKALIREHAFHICLMPSRKLNESVSILWPRQKDGKRAVIESSNHLHSYLKERMPQYTAGADRIIYTHHASIEKVSATVLGLLKQ